MNRYTFQTCSRSGSFAHPEGTDVDHAGSIPELHAALECWAWEHGRVGSESADAYLIVWKGDHEDVTDVYPDFECRLGPRGGLNRQPL